MTIQRAAEMLPVDLRCECLHQTLGIDVSAPRLSWRLEPSRADARGQKQSAYRILVASSEARLAADRGDLWDSTEVLSAQSIHIVYRGKTLESGKRYHWKVRCWDEGDRLTPWSAPSWWETGLLTPSDWEGKPINDGKTTPARDEDFYGDDAAPLFRKRFIIDQPIRRARLYASGLGYADLSLNGRSVSDHVLDPAWTSYAKRVLYAIHDVQIAISIRRTHPREG